MSNRVFFSNNINMTFKSYINKVFIYVAFGLLISGGFAFIIGSNYFTIFQILGKFGIIGTLLPIILELVIAFYFSSRLFTMNKQTAYICYFLYSALTGISFSYIFVIYDIGNIMLAFSTTALLFVCMSIIGNNSKVDLSKFSSFLFFGLLGIIISTLLNAFIFKSAAADMFISYIAVIIFLVLTAYDMQRLRSLYNSGLNDGDLYDKLLIFGSFQLYLDFINLFIRVLQIFSSRRRN